MATNDRLRAIISQELSYHPNMEIADLYKLAYQAAFGFDHAFPIDKHFRSSVANDWAASHREAQIRAVQVIDPSGSVARLHLGPCKRSDVSVESVIDLVIYQPRRNASLESFASLWEQMLELVAQEHLPFDLDTADEYAECLCLPHHSKAYGPAHYLLLNDITDSRTLLWLQENLISQ